MARQAELQTENLGEKAAGAAKWSTVTQVAMKLIQPVTTMVLARILKPESFGIVASATMVVSLADLISDTGFQSYIVQHRFENADEESLSACVAFWSNLAISLTVVALVFLARNQIAHFVGSDGYGPVLAVASLALPMTSLVSVQTALFRKRFDFRSLFGAGVGYSVTNFGVSVGLAIAGFDYWSMVAGTLASTAFRAAWLTAKSPWRPSLRYSFSMLREMLSYGLWILGESAAAWVNSWAGTFIIGTRLDSESVGYFKTSTTISNGLINVITGALMPVAFSALSEVQSDSERFERIFLRMQGYLALCVIPLGLGGFVYRRAMTLVLLGGQWLETSLFLGLWMLASCIVVVFGYLCSEAYHAKGMPHLCVIVQVAYLVPFIPALYVSSGYGYGAVTLAMPLVRLILPCINLYVMHRNIGISPMKMLANCRWYYLLSLLAMLPGLVVTIVTDSLVAEFLAIAASVALYVCFVLSVRTTRLIVVDFVDKMGYSRFIPSQFRSMGERET